MEGRAGGFPEHRQLLISKQTHSGDETLKMMNSGLDTIITAHVFLNSGWVALVNWAVMREKCELPSTGLQQALELDLFVGP